ncbi:hypothetical protein ACPOLB_11425 [Rubrivivax sp. RP6-9]|uniref:hypothetical protein n=1 Tax=Rubrivivax sp. RP6-9 TaxID=3415750 RepID=UPI003CC56063
MPQSPLHGGLRAAACLAWLAALASLAPHTAAAAAGACGAAACTAEQLSRCRQANEMMQEQLRQLPASGPADRERKAALQARVQAMLAEHRRKGVDACTTWGEMGRIAANQ